MFEHVKNHGGKRSQLSAFLEEVCSDIELKEGRGRPMVELPVDGGKTKRPEDREPEDRRKEDRNPDAKKGEAKRGRCGWC